MRGPRPPARGHDRRGMTSCSPVSHPTLSTRGAYPAMVAMGLLAGPGQRTGVPPVTA
jgi:hypothetical protein